MFVFGYGSLLWNPGFPHREARPALARGWSRRSCVPSTVHRGTPERPGRVLGLVRGGDCVGVAYRVSAGREDEVMEYLRIREMCEAGYRAELLPVETGAGRIEAICYVAEATPASGCGSLSATIRQARGKSGANLDYALAALRAVAGLRTEPGWPHPCDGFPPGVAEEIGAQLGAPPAADARGPKKLSLEAIS